jgi:Telomere-capping, CST complex subunit
MILQENSHRNSTSNELEPILSARIVRNVDGMDTKLYYKVIQKRREYELQESGQIKQQQMQ